MKMPNALSCEARVIRRKLRCEAPCCIPGAAGRDLEGGLWAEWLTWIRKVKGTTACQEIRQPIQWSESGCRRGPCDMAKLRREALCRIPGAAGKDSEEGS